MFNSDLASKAQAQFIKTNSF